MKNKIKDPTTQKYLKDLERQLDDERDNLSCAHDLQDARWIDKIEERIRKLEADIRLVYEQEENQYKTMKFVCFDCQTTATSPVVRAGTMTVSMKPKCPSCREPMRAMGIDFKRPKKNDKKKWKEAEQKYYDRFIDNLSKRLKDDPYVPG